MRNFYTLRVCLSFLLLLESFLPLHVVLAKQPSIDDLEQTASLVLVKPANSPILSAPLALPDPPTNPNPADAAVNVSIFLDQLTWTCAPDATSYTYRIWLSTDPKPSQGFNTSNCLGYIPILHPESSLLRGNATYKWEVISNNASGSTPGPEWSFTTESMPDIKVSKPSTPASAVDGATISFTYTITNTGLLASSPSGWFEGLYLSSDPVLYPGTDIYLGSFSNPSILTPGQAVTLVREVQLPPNTMGAYYTFVRLSLNSIDGNYANNTSPAGDPINIGVTPRPDLTVSIPQMPALVANDEIITATITVTNQGTLAAAGWTDRLYLSPTPTYNYFTALLVSEQAHPGTLAAGQAEVRSLSVHIPANISGSYYAFAQTDAQNALVESDENNNFSTSGFSVQVNALPPPEPSQPNPLSGSLNVPVGIVLSWQATVRTQSYEVRLWPQGQERPNSANASVNISAYDPPGNLGANTVFNWEVTAVGIGGSASGPTWTFTTQPLPDLVVSAVNPPTQAFSGQQIQVDWVVSNQGSSATTGSWYDSVYLTSSPIFDLGTAVSLGTSTNPAALAPGESYQRSAIFTLPQGISGPYYFHVRTDRNNALLEDLETNNVNHSASPIDIQLTPPPDLQVTDLQGPAAAFSGSDILVQWKVTNQGTGDTGLSGWYDKLYLSKDTVLDLNADFLLNRSYHGGILAPGSSYTQTTSAQLPQAISGDYYLFLVADAEGNVFENIQENNNTSAPAGPLVITLSPPPDLEIASWAVPSSGFSGQNLRLTLQVINNGAGPTFEYAWYDRFYLSPSAIFTTTNATVLDTVVHYGSLQPGASYTQTLDVKLPNGISGTYFLHAWTDYTNRVFELDADNNNTATSAAVSISLTSPPDLQPELLVLPGAGSITPGSVIQFGWKVSNLGSGAPQYAWRDGVYLSTSPTWNNTAILLKDLPRDTLLAPGSYYTLTTSLAVPSWLQPGLYYLYVFADHQDRVYEHSTEDNNIVRSPQGLTILPGLLGDLPDLAISNLGAPASGFSSQPITVTWTVTNLGGKTRTTSWVDGVYLSQDILLDSGDLLLGTRLQTSSLDAGASYNTQRAFSLPDGITGSRFLIFASDIGKGVYENDRANNLAVLQPALPITLSPWPNLAIMPLAPAANSTLPSGQGIQVSWRVDNHGSGTPQRSWYDGVYLSSDPFLDISDLRLSSEPRQALLGPGQAYTQTLWVRLPPTVDGNLYLLFKTDTQDKVFENGAKGDNLAGVPVDVTLSALADLVVESVSTSASAQTGELVTLNWTLRNQGANPAKGRMCDAFFLSPDTVWDYNDASLANICFDVLLSPGQTTQKQMKANLPDSNELAALAANLSVKAPGITPGAYYGIVRTDVLNNIPESSELNNTGTSAITLTLDMPALSLGVPVSGSLLKDHAAYYKVNVPAGETLQVSLDSTASTGFNELYVSYGAAPTRSQFDYGFTDPEQPDQTVLASETISGTYYILAYAALEPQPSSSYALRADLVQFGLRSLDLDKAGNSGLVSFQVNGTLLTTATQYSLTDALGKVYLPAEVLHLDSTRALLSFDLTGAAPGPASVAAQEGALSAQLTGALQIQAGFPGELSLKIEAPKSVRRGELILFYLSYGNTGGTDLPIPLLVFEAPGASYLGLDPEGEHLGGLLFIYGVPQRPLFTRLRPGEMVRMAIYGRLDASTDTLFYPASMDSPGLADIKLDWDAIQARAGNSDVATAAVDYQHLKYGDNLATYYAGVQTELEEIVAGGYPYLVVRHINARWYFAYPSEKQGKARTSINPLGFTALPGDPHYVDSPTIALQLRPSLEADGEKNTYVAIITNSDYAFRRETSNPDWRDTEDLPGTINDAQQVYDFFSKTIKLPAYQITTLIDRPDDNFVMTPSHVLTAIKNLPYDGDDNLVIYYSGHGSDNNGDWFLNGGSLSYNGLGNALLTKTPGSVYLIMDSCHSGAFVNLLLAGNSSLMAASDDVQSANEVKEGFGRFTLELFNRLNRGQSVNSAYVGAEKAVTRRNIAGLPYEKQQNPQLVIRGTVDMYHPWKPPSDVDQEVRNKNNDLDKDNPPGNAPAVPPAAKPKSAPVGVVTSADPNDILGPAGCGDAHWVPARDTFGYTIRFENDPTLASAPAQKVIIRQRLDGDLDLRTFRLGSFGFHNLVFNVPENRSYYMERLDLSATLGIYVDVVAGVDFLSREAFWSLQSIDPQTGAPPSDPTQGFLPPNNAAGDGDGFVTYSVKAKSNAPSGTVVDALATIIFDQNDPLDTPAIFNTLDAGQPQASLNSLPGIVQGDEVVLNWTGSDSAGGSGLAGVDLYVSENNGPFLLWQEGITSTVLLFSGQVGNTYAFFVQAVDFAGNREPLQSNQEASTRLSLMPPELVFLPLVRR